MSNRKRKDIETALKNKGFEPRNTKADHRYYYFYLEGKRMASTKVSLGTQYKDIGDPLLSKMARQCHLNKEDFLNLIDCSMSKEEYENILKKQGIN